MDDVSQGIDLPTQGMKMVYEAHEMIREAVDLF